jgi:hypothetical protein
VTSLPELVLYTRAGCGLCDEARSAIQLVFEDRAARNLAVPAVVEIDIDANPELQRRLFDRIPVVALGDRRVELVVTVGKLRRLLNEALGDAPVEPPTS